MKFFWGLQLAFVLHGGGSCSIPNQTSICCRSPAGPPQKIEFVLSCQSRNKSKRALGACAPLPWRVYGKTWQAAR